MNVMQWRCIAAKVASGLPVKVGLVEDNGSANRSRWPTHPTWLALREQFAAAAQAQPFDEDQRRLCEDPATAARTASYGGRRWAWSSRWRSRTPRRPAQRL
jgi:hypothetical protein